jgi:hypothetical protein
MEAVLEDNRAELRMMIDPQHEACHVVAKREAGEALRIAIANLETHKKEHGC